MGNEENFAESWLSSRHKVFGLNLRPFSNWHRFLLTTAHSPLLKENEVFTLSDVYRFCKICSVNYPKTPKFSWVDKLRFKLYLKSHDKLSDQIKDYLDDHNAVPTYTIQEDEGKASTGDDLNEPPEPITQIISLMSLGYSEKEAWDMNIGKTSWVLTVHAKMQGVKVLFDSAKEDQILEMLRAQKASGEEDEEIKRVQEELMKDMESGNMPKHIMNRKTI